MSRITFEEMLELASSGSKVLHTRAVELANKNKVALRVLSSFNDVAGTLITSEDQIMMEAPLISGIAFTKDEAKLTLRGVKDQPGIASKILAPISEASIEVDMIVQNTGADGNTDFTFTVQRSDFQTAHQLLADVARTIEAAEVLGWTRFRDEADPDVMALPFFADAFPPTVFTRLGPIGWVPTLELTVHVRRRPAPGWLACQVWTDDVHNGKLIESVRLWDSNGDLVAQGRQLGYLITGNVGG